MAATSDAKALKAISAIKTCTVCQMPTRVRCSQCKKVYYCGAACQSQDWSAHKPECSPPKRQVVDVVELAARLSRAFTDAPENDRSARHYCLDIDAKTGVYLPVNRATATVATGANGEKFCKSKFCKSMSDADSKNAFFRWDRANGCDTASTAFVVGLQSLLAKRDTHEVLFRGVAVVEVSMAEVKLRASAFTNPRMQFKLGVMPLLQTVRESGQTLFVHRFPVVTLVTQLYGTRYYALDTTEVQYDRQYQYADNGYPLAIYPINDSITKKKQDDADADAEWTHPPVDRFGEAVVAWSLLTGEDIQNALCPMDALGAALLKTMRV